MTISDELLFPALEPYHHELLAVSQTHSIYLEQCGNPDGMPVVVLHGGPGSGCTPAQRRFFNPRHYRIILIDQRGCKRSQPMGCIEENTTSHLISDIEKVRQHLGISRWLVFGGSWGSTLALAYATSHPEPVNGLILRGIFLCRESELEWFLHQVRHFFPDAWERFTGPLSLDAKSSILETYTRMIFSSDAASALSAATAWSNFEAEIMSLLPTAAQSTIADDDFIIGRARIQLHYLAHGGFIDGDALLAAIDCIRHVPAFIVQGRYDMVCPPITAHELHQAWPEARLEIIPDAGHSAMEPGIMRALLAATNSFIK